jgi:hypothetical protein
MLDAARVETIQPPAHRADRELPRVVPEGLRPAPVHRRPVARRTPARHLLVADGVVAPFDPPPARRPTLPARMTWTAESGFDGDDDPSTTPAARFVPSATPRRERPPWATAALVHELTGVDVSDAVVDRSPSTGERAAELGAVAFTEAGTVHLPAELGDLDEPRTRAVLAHELTHVAQQRRRGTAPPDETSEVGLALEDEARSVQYAAHRGVRPHVLRPRRHVPGRGGAVGVQRLADDDPYAWQERDDEVSPSETRDMSGLFRGYSVRSDSAWGRRIARDEREWADGFENRHARRLVERRNDRYEELLEQALDERRAAAVDPTAVRLGRREVLEVRARVDEEMPFEHGVPEGFSAFPDRLPDPTPADEGDIADADAEADAEVPGSTPVASGDHPRRRARVVPAAPVARPATGDARAARRPARAPSTGGARPSRSAATATTEYDWQRREPTESQTVAALFGGGLLGDLLGRAVGPETDEHRARAERERLPELLDQRHRRERELRHRRLREHLRDRSTVEAREETPEPRRSREPIRLTAEEITGIREQIDEELPLEFAVPEYLPPDADVQIAHDGTIAALDADAAAESPASTSPVPEGTDPHTATFHPAAADGTTTDAGVPAESSPPARGPASAVVDAEDRGAVGFAAAAAIGSALDRARGQREDTDTAEGDAVHDRQQAAASTLLSSASEHDIDALSRRIWSRIRREMRTELLIDRERAGVLADLC